MSLSDVATVASRDPCSIVAGEAASKDVTAEISLRQADEESKVNPNKLEAPADVPPFDTVDVVDGAGKSAKFTDTKDAGGSTSTIDPKVLKDAALEDANRILGTTLTIDLDKVGVKDARIIMSEEHKCLGYRPPADSLAAKAQRSSAKHPDSSLGLDVTTLKEAARVDAERIKMDRKINITTLTAQEARRLQSEEQKVLGYRPPPGSLSAEAQSVVDKRDREPVTKGSSSDHKDLSPLQKKRNRRKLNKDPASTSTP